MINLRVLILVNSHKEKDLFYRFLNNYFIVDFVSSINALDELLCLKHYDVVLISHGRFSFLKYFDQLRNQVNFLLVIFIKNVDLDEWRLRVKNTNSILLLRPVPVAILIQHLEQYALLNNQIKNKLFQQSKLQKILSSQYDMNLSVLEKQCLQVLLEAQSFRVHKLYLQKCLFGEGGYLCDARLDSCWHRLRKKLAIHAPQIKLKRQYNGFLEIAACAH